MPEMNNGRNEDLKDRPISELLVRLTDQVSTLVRQEMQLARAEMTEKAKGVGKGAGFLGGAGLFGITAFGTLTITLIAALFAAGLAVWLSALIITVLYAIIAGVLALTGKKELKRVSPPVPEQTIESIKETVQWGKTQAKSGTR